MLTVAWMRRRRLRSDWKHKSSQDEKYFLHENLLATGERYKTAAPRRQSTFPILNASFDASSLETRRFTMRLIA
jgi:hypothetical protein